MLLIKNADSVYTLESAAAKQGKNICEGDLSLKTHQSILVDAKNKICWIGESDKLPKKFHKRINQEINAKGKTILPSFVECHTHTVFAGSRSHEFELRNQGVSYQEIAAKGGGILSTQRALGEINEKTLLSETQKRIDHFVRQGVSVIEVKSGYGLDLVNEIKSLNILKKIKNAHIVPTFLGAHAIPKNYKNENAYLNYLVKIVFPEIKKKKLANRVDIFIEKGFFSKEKAKTYLRFFKKNGFEIVIHADQMSLSGGSDLAVELGAQSADHVIKIQDEQIKKLSKSNVTAVLLPLADLYMKCDYPPARKLLDQGARVALATDFNPGSCPSQDINLVGLLARLEMKMKLHEVISAYTISSSFALNLQNLYGSIEVGKVANLNILNGDISDLFYSAGSFPVDEMIYFGQCIKNN